MDFPPHDKKGLIDFLKQLGEDKGIAMEQTEEESFKSMRPTSLIKKFSGVV